MDTNELNFKKNDLISALQLENRISAMKHIRTMTGAGLREAKNILEAFEEAWGPKPLTDPDYQPEQPQYIVAVQADYETWTNTFNCEQSAMDYAEGRTPREAVTVGRVIAKSVAKTTYTLERV